MESLEDRKRCVCKYCGAEFEKSISLATHVRSTHKNTKHKRIVCIYCNNPIADNTYTRHIKSCKDRYKPYKCIKCGKLVEVRYGSGRFCSRRCSNSRQRSEETKQKISNSAKNNLSGCISQECRNRSIEIFKKKREDYYLHPNRCSICGKILLYTRRNSKTCGNKECRYANCGGLRIGSVKGRSGTYKGFYCDSTYELAFLIYCLDHNIPIERNRESFLYYYKGKQYKYYPDFLINNRMLVEIKNYRSELTDAKIKGVKDSNRGISILYGDDLIKIFEYVSKTYDKKFKIKNNRPYGPFEELYDNK